MKRLGSILGGGILMVLFLSWMLFKGTDEVRAVTEANPLLGWIGLGLAWLCALGGAALLARATILPKTFAHEDE